MIPHSGVEVESIEATIRHFVVSNFLFGRGGDGLTNHDSFIARGIIDSTGVLELSLFIEQTFQTPIADDELIPDNFDSIHCLAQYVRRKLEQQPQPR